MSKHLAKNVTKTSSRPVSRREETPSYVPEEDFLDSFREAAREPAQEYVQEPVQQPVREPAHAAAAAAESYEESRSRKSRKKKDRNKTAEEFESYEEARAGKTRKKGGRVLVIVIIVLAILIILAELAYIFAFGTLYSKMTITEPMTATERAAAINSFSSTTEQQKQEEEQQQLLLREEEEELDENAVSATQEEIANMQSRIQSQLTTGSGLMSQKDVINILLIGTDARAEDENSRSDVMLLVSANSSTKKIVLTSFMRDIYTYIPDYGYNRLNAPFAIGGGEYLMETLEADFGVDIDNYVSIDFYAFADMIDILGGIDLELTTGEVDFINEQAYDGEQAQLGVGTGSIYLDYSSDGWYHLNGTQALAHCRNRSSAGSDFDRTTRQRTVIAALIEQAKSISLTEMYALADQILPTVTTDLTQGECLSLLLKVSDYLGYEVESLRIPADTEFTSAIIDGMAVLSIDFAASSQLLQDAIYGDGGTAAETISADGENGE